MFFLLFLSFTMIFTSAYFLSISPVTSVPSVILSSFYPVSHLPHTIIVTVPSVTLSSFTHSLTSPTQPSLLFPLLLCLLLPCPFFTFLSHFLIVAFPCYFSSTKAHFRQVLTLFFCSILFLLSITKPSIYVFICTYFHVII